MTTTVDPNEPWRKPKSHLSTCYLAFGDQTLRATAVQSGIRTSLKLSDRDTNRTPNPGRTTKRRKISDSKQGDESTDDDSDRSRTLSKTTITSFTPIINGSTRVNRAPPKPRSSTNPSRRSMNDTNMTSDRSSYSGSKSHQTTPMSMRTPLDVPFTNTHAQPAVDSLPRAQELPSAPVFRPSLEEWADPMAYIRSITPQCRAAGLCKIIPPETWSPPFCLDSRRFSFTTREQNLHELQSGVPFGESNKNYTLGQFQQLAEQFKQHFRRSSTGKFTSTEIEKEYWSIVNAQSPAIQVEYGADLDSSSHGSGFEPLLVGEDTVKNDARPYSQSIGWNLRALPLVRGSLLGMLKEHVTGVSTPWLYVGMLFSSFCWHTEDSYLYSINYLHCGAGKSWYSVSGDSVVQMEEAMKAHYPHLFHNQPNLHHQLALQMDPHILHHYDVQPYHCVQYPGEFVVTFPAAYHCGFSHGFNVGEAVDFALDLWLPYGRMASEHYRQFQRPSLFSLPELLISMSKQASDNTDFDIDIFLTEFDSMIQLEKEGRTKALEFGVRKMEHISLPTPAKMSIQSTSSTSGTTSTATSAHITCAICNEDCYLSHVSCSRCRTPAVCLNHIEYACQCENYDKVCLNYSFSIQQLHQMRNAVANRRLVAKSQSDLPVDISSSNIGMSTMPDFTPSFKLDSRPVVSLADLSHSPLSEHHQSMHNHASQ